MKRLHGMLALIALTIFSIGSAHAEKVWFSLDVTDMPPPDTAVHYETADKACKAGYDQDVSVWNTETSTVLPYLHVRFDKSGPSPWWYWCQTPVLLGESTVNYIPHIVAVIGTECDEGAVLDIVAGACVAKEKDDKKKDEGDVDNQPGNHPVVCVGNPINPAIGNKFQREPDFVDEDGELAFIRFYNGLEGAWTHSYSAFLGVSDNSATLMFDDGRTALFALVGTVWTGQGPELGSLTKTGSTWTYSSPDNQTFVFNSQGQLTSVTAATGLRQTLAYGMDNEFRTVVTVKDSRGHALSWTEDYNGYLSQMVAGGVSVAYSYSPTSQLTSATKTVGAKSTTRSYVYEDARNPMLLTGIIDERGVRFATWSYDEQGRAVTSQHAGGVEKTTVEYIDDATTRVTNALGHRVTYTFQTVAGARRLTAVSGEPAPGCPVSNSSFTYDARGQTATQTDALGHVTAFVYDAQGRETSRTEAKGTADERVTTTTWDGTSFRRKTVTTPDRVTTYAYDANGRLVSTSVKAR
jgi:YD repeat-containing protein